MAVKEDDLDAALCRRCHSYQAHITTAQSEAAHVAGRATRALARMAGEPSLLVDQLSREAVRLRDSARTSERRLAQHRAEVHGS